MQNQNHSRYPAIDPVTEAYLTLGLRIERCFPGFVDGYHGDPALKAAVDAGPTPTPVELLHEAEALAGAVEAASIMPQRKAFLRAQVRAMVMNARKLTGEQIPYTDEVRTLFDIEPDFTPEATFDAAITQLDELLPGQGAVGERMVAWRNRTVVSPEVARELIDIIGAETRRRTLPLIDLPDGETVEFAMVQNKPWSGYNWFLGNGTSLVEINTDLPIRASALLDLIAHEAYPGHHTEHMLKETQLYHGKGWGEYAIQLINTPECVISEGIATLAADWIFPGDSGERWLAEEIYPRIGIVGEPEREYGIASAAAALAGVGGNTALLLHDRGATEREAIAYQMRYGLDDESRATHRLSFLQDPLWRAYVFCYHSGRGILGAWLAEAPEELPTRIRTLMLEPITPSGIGRSAED